jgi:hypothetical protein
MNLKCLIGVGASADPLPAKEKHMRFLLSLSLLGFVACGGSSGGGGTTSQVAQLTITATGIRTQTGGSANFSVPNPGTVMFINSDTTAHSITSSQCPDLDTGTLAPGASFTANLSNPSTATLVCTFSDATNPSPAFAGTITILTTNTGGSGY